MKNTREKLMKRILLIACILLIGCGADSNKWTEEAQNHFLNECQKSKNTSNQYCDCILSNLMTGYDEQSYKSESTQMLKNNASQKFLDSINSISEICDSSSNTE